jgi:hypothetical protein
MGLRAKRKGSLNSSTHYALSEASEPERSTWDIQ